MSATAHCAQPAQQRLVNEKRMCAVVELREAMRARVENVLGFMSLVSLVLAVVVVAAIADDVICG